MSRNLLGIGQRQLLFHGVVACVAIDQSPWIKNTDLVRGFISLSCTAYAKRFTLPLISSDHMRIGTDIVHKGVWRDTSAVIGTGIPRDHYYTVWHSELNWNSPTNVFTDENIAGLAVEALYEARGLSNAQERSPTIMSVMVLGSQVYTSSTFKGNVDSISWLYERSPPAPLTRILDLCATEKELTGPDGEEPQRHRRAAACGEPTLLTQYFNRNPDHQPSDLGSAKIVTVQWKGDTGVVLDPCGYARNGDLRPDIVGCADLFEGPNAFPITAIGAGTVPDYDTTTKRSATTVRSFPVEAFRTYVLLLPPLMVPIRVCLRPPISLMWLYAYLRQQSRLAIFNLTLADRHLGRCNSAATAIILQVLAL